MLAANRFSSTICILWNPMLLYLEAGTELNALSPLDGRYSKKVNVLKDYFSEQSLMK